MYSISQNTGGSQEAKYRLAFHIQKRNKIKDMYRQKGVQMLDKPELVFSDIQQPQLKLSQNSVYQAMQGELTERGYSDFRFLGNGAQGLVLLAKDSKTNIRYAIKGIEVRDLQGNSDNVLDNQVKQEIEILKKCRGSPNVVSLLDSFEGKQFTYIVLNECQGTLSEILEKNQNGRLNEISAIKYAKDIAEGLYYIHSKNCLVNDLKMDNILIDYHGNAVVSDFGYADNLTNKSCYALHQYMGNFLYQAPECYDPTKSEIGKDYHYEYKKLGVNVKQEPSNRSEAFSLGYLIYTLVQGVDFKLTFNKHKKLNYDGEFYNFVYQKHLKYIIDGLTNFVPRDRLSIKEALIILKGIISFEFQLDDLLVETIDRNTQQFTSSFKNGIEFVQNLSDKFYPIIKNEQTLYQELKKDNQKIEYEVKLAEFEQANLLLKQRISEQEETVKYLQAQLQQAQNQSISQFQMIKNTMNQNNKPKKMKGYINHEFCNKMMVMMINNKDNKDWIKIEIRDRNKISNGSWINKWINSWEDDKHHCVMVQDINKKRIGFIKKEDWKNKHSMMIFYEKDDCKKQMGKVILGKQIEIDRDLIYNCMDRNNCYKDVDQCWMMINKMEWISKCWMDQINNQIKMMDVNVQINDVVKMMTYYSFECEYEFI